MKRWLIAVVLAAFASMAQAQDAWPSKVIRIVVPYPAGRLLSPT